MYHDRYHGTRITAKYRIWRTLSTYDLYAILLYMTDLMVFGLTRMVFGKVNKYGIISNALDSVHSSSILMFVMTLLTVCALLFIHEYVHSVFG